MKNVEIRCLTDNQMCFRPKHCTNELRILRHFSERSQGIYMLLPYATFDTSNLLPFPFSPTNVKTHIHFLDRLRNLFCILLLMILTAGLR